MGLIPARRWTWAAPVMWLGLLGVGIALMGCHGESKTGQPAEVASRLLGGALRGDTAAVAAELTRATRARAGEVIAEVTRNDSLQRVEWVSTNIWSEQGANVDVKRTFRGGRSDQLRLELKRERGDWRVAKAE
ncbi:MAG TPA: hypothetical protein VF720_09460 [Candidatus Eisenbacteria bacterium]